ncbi:MAG: ribonuclease III [Alphaproteobacteria bacterium]|nr:ribonuclease III [Alphaproteobacteria bacterium]
MRDLRPLEEKLGHRFTDRGLLERALTHASATSTHSNERLEFLGDRVLGLVVAETLHARHASESEGALTVRFHALVRAEACARVAEAADLPTYVRLAGPGFESARARGAILSDVCEAVIAALYLDGGMAAARDFINRYWAGMFEDPGRGAQMRDAKTRLQEWAQGRGLPAPAYRETARTGPAHAPHFVIEAQIEGEAPQSGEGGSKREAEQDAAAKLLTRVGA